MLGNNPYLADLMKLAADGEAEVIDEPMNPDPNPVISQEEVDAAKAEEVAQQEGAQAEEQAIAAQAVQEEVNQAAAQVAAEAQEQQAIQAAAENIVAQEATPAVPTDAPVAAPGETPVDVPVEEVAPPVVAEPVAPAVPADIPPEIAAQLPEYGAIAKLAELATSGHAPADIQKVASERLTTAMTNFDSYVEVITKTANELFGNEENLADLHSREGIEFVVEKLAEFTENNPFEKTADEGESFSNKVVKSVANFVDSVKNYKEIGTELEKAQMAFDTATAKLTENVLGSEGITPEYDSLLAKQTASAERAAELQGKQRLGKAGIIGGVALAGAGAYAGGKKIYDTIQNRQEQLNEEKPSDTLEAGNQNQITGGTERMANTKQLVKDFLKVAGAAGLVSIVGDENADMELRKEASDRFDSIASLGRTDMLEEFVKVAQEIYTPEQLEQIVAGQHTEQLLNKIAGIMSYNEMSASEILEKVADAGGVAAKGVAGALTDAASNVQATIKEDKKATEAEGREYVGDTDKSGKVGGQLVGGLEGYEVIKNPGKYNVDKTASEIVEEAVMMKQAAVRTFNEAQAVIDQYTKA